MFPFKGDIKHKKKYTYSVYSEGFEKYPLG